MTHRPVVLVLEDDPMLRRYLCILCDTAGCHAVPASWGGEARLLAERGRPDLILADLDESDFYMDGLEALRELLSGSNTRGIPVIALGEGRQRLPELARTKVRLVDFIEKPVVTKLLLERLRSWVRGGNPGRIPE